MFITAFDRINELSYKNAKDRGFQSFSQSKLPRPTSTYYSLSRPPLESQKQSCQIRALIFFHSQSQLVSCARYPFSRTLKKKLRISLGVKELQQWVSNDIFSILITGFHYLKNSKRWMHWATNGSFSKFCFGIVI